MTPPTAFPDEILSGHDGWAVEFAWEGEWTNTWRLESPGGDTRFVKVGWPDHYPTITDERERMVWAGRYISVPEVLGHGSNGDVEWMVTSKLPGRDATFEKLHVPPDEIVPFLARGLRTWHETLPVSSCPFDFTIDRAIEHCERRVRGERTTWEGFRGKNPNVSPAQALDRLKRDRPDDEDLVVCHGDYCFPNVLIDAGAITGYLDLGELGVADRWWDIAIGAWSVTWNVDPKWEPLFYEGYGIEPDEARIWYYRTLYELAA